jgi:predicted HicB family RNase H-like nuclease
MKTKRGRPPKPKSELAEERIELRLLPAEKAEWQTAAERAGQSLSAWIRERLTRAAKRESKRD